MSLVNDQSWRCADATVDPQDPPLHGQVAMGQTQEDCAEEFSVSLCLFGPDLNPLQVSALLGTEPSFATDADGLEVPRPRVPGSWILSLRGFYPERPEALLAELLKQLPTTPSLWADFKSRFEIHLYVGLHSSAFRYGFSLGTEALHTLADLGLELEFDIYHYE